MNQEEKRVLEEKIRGLGNRPRTPKEDEKLLKPLWAFAYDMAHLLGGEDWSYVLRLPQPWRALLTTFKLDLQVRNGGFHQFFWNSEGIANEATDEDLALFGATGFQKIFKQAVACAAQFKVVETKCRSENTWEDFTTGYKTIPWETHDAAYYEACPTLFQHIAGYVRANPTAFKTSA
jgi:hypothetical protein